MPIKVPEDAGQPYQPSNGMEGDMFQEMFCCRCKHDSEENPCQILMRTMCHDISDPDYPQEWKFNEGGYPTCTAFEEKP